MIGRRVAIEVLYLAGGVLLAIVIGWGSAWAYPLGRQDIWTVDLVAIAVILLMGIRPLRDAAAADQAAQSSAREPTDG